MQTFDVTLTMKVLAETEKEAEKELNRMINDMDYFVTLVKDSVSLHLSQE
jgi:hypothetical protein